MVQVQFKAKIEDLKFTDGTSAGRRIYPPKKLTAKHCVNLQSWRTSRKFGSYANSDLFPAIIARALRDQLGLELSRAIKLDDLLPDGIAVDESGFLAVVTLTLSDS